MNAAGGSPGNHFEPVLFAKARSLTAPPNMRHAALPESFGNMTALNKLYLNKNQLTSKRPKENVQDRS